MDSSDPKAMRQVPCLVGRPCSPVLKHLGTLWPEDEDESAVEFGGSAEWGEGKCDPGQGATCSKAGDKKGWRLCVARLEPHTAEVAPEVG